MATVLLVGGVFGPVLGGILTDICQRAGGPRRTMSVLSLVMVPSIVAGLFAVMPGIVSASIPLTIFLVIGGVINVMMTALSVTVIPNELRGLCMAIQFAGGSIVALGIAPVTVSLLSGAMGGPAAIGQALALICATTGILGAAAFAFGRRYFPEAICQ
jgi:MFS family permease